jgi:hypothetical protein
MAKKVVATMGTGLGKSFTRVIKMVKSSETGTYGFKEDVLHNELVKDFLANK